MSLKNKTVRTLLGLVSWLVLTADPALPAWAGLGDLEASVRSDSVKLKASPRVISRPSFTVHEMPMPAGTVIREFVAASGVVFAVSWQGPFKPDMNVLLGRYIGTYARAPRSPGSTRSRLMIEQPNLIVHAGGHMRAFAGIAYVPQLLPANITEGDLR